MTTGPRSQCDACRHLRLGALDLPLACTAFPDGIPKQVLDNMLDHRLPVDGDNGVRFAAEVGDEFPAYAFA